MAQINGRDVKYVVTAKKSSLYKEILDAGFNAMPDSKKEELARTYLLRKGQ